ncbi:uncharacterized protein YjlB [Bosea sp. OAE506]|uniref:cupin n=1 Tax=Bosea sp. OAE506 TaxID=2663870 RepID=UPI00178BD66A
MTTATAIHLEMRGFIPNNPRLPLVVYDAAFPSDTVDLAAQMEKRFAANGWPPQWRNGIYDYDHYHTQGHEVLGIAAGSATLVLGGEGGRCIEVSAGDVLLLPVGTGHRCVRHSDDFLVIGAYPPGQVPDIVLKAATPAMLNQIAVLSFPASDPVHGADGPLSKLWADQVVRGR